MPKITQLQKEAVRIDILNTARNVFIEKGYEAASMSDIVTSSNRSFGGVYLYYSNKEDVFLDLLRREYKNMALDFVSDSSIWSAFVQFMKEQEKRIREVDASLAPCVYEYFIAGRRKEERRKLIEERYEAVYKNIFTFLNNGVQRGELHPSQPLETFVHWLISLLDGLFLESMINGFENIQLAKQFEFVLTICRSALMPSEMGEINDKYSIE